MHTPSEAIQANEPQGLDNPQVQALVSYLDYEAQPMIVLDPDYNILAANTAYQRQFGARGQTYVGHKCYQVSHHYDVPCDQAGEHCPMKKAQELRGPDRVLHIHHTPRGPEHVDVELRPILQPSGAIVAYVERVTTLRNASVKARSQGLVGHSDVFNQALFNVQRVAPSTLPVLLLGESGTGKELFARAVHEASDRAQGPFVVVDCSGFSETLFESELFGYEKGAFTGAIGRKPGLVETAKGGTLFLDEIGDVPLPMQVKLLRLIETGTFRRVGSVETQRADFRLVAATHQPLQAMVEDGRFRRDLYFRIAVFPIDLPPLRERPEDLPVLIESILQRGNRLGGRLTVDDEALAAMRAHPWPGNIRELRNVLERARLLADDGQIHRAHLPSDLLRASALPGPLSPAPQGQALNPNHRPSTSAATAAPTVQAPAPPLDLATTIATFQGSRKALAQHLGLSERTLYRRLKAQGLA